MKRNSGSISRRGFLAKSAVAGALGCASGIRASGSAPDIEPSAQGGHGGEDALVAPQYRGFVKKSVTELPTPALLIDLDIFEHNLQTLASYMKRPAGHLPAARQGAQVAGGRQAAARVRRQGAVRGEAGRGRRPDPRRHQGRPHHRRSRRQAQDRAAHEPAGDDPRRQGGGRQRAERDRSLGGGARLQADA